MSVAYFTATSAGFEPYERAQGPWSPDMLHGRLLGALGMRAVELAHGESGLRPARLTVDLFRSAPMATVTVELATVREGRRVRLVDATLNAGGFAVARVSALLLRPGDQPAGRSWRPEPWTAPHPATVPDDPGDADPPPGAEPPPWKIRTVEGGFGRSERARVWTLETASLVDGEPLSPVVRTALSGDLASPLANSTDEGLAFINADYTVALGRLPIGEWIGLEASQHLANDGIALAACTLYDLDGPFATSTTSAVANPPLTT
ncbi:MAG: thioesterase family protein [Acidimicrobiia bacterium]|nr:thioesterase family protein [Acidimicrobiia bacterium]